LEFQVHTVIDRADLSSSAGKDKALAELTPIFSVAEPSAERDEQLRLVADRLDLSEHLLAPLMARSGQGRFERSPGSVSDAASKGERWERIFLAMCVSGGDHGRAYLDRLSEDHLSSESLRRARSWILEHFDSPTAGLGQDEQLAQTVSEIVVRAAGQPADERALEVGFLGLELRRLEREIKQAAAAEDFERQRQLVLERNRTTEEIVRLMGDEGAVGKVSRRGATDPAS
jgi:hypothetical protein